MNKFCSVLLTVSFTVLITVASSIDPRCSISKGDRRALTRSFRNCGRRNAERTYRYEPRFNRCMIVPLCPDPPELHDLIFETKKTCNAVCRSSDSTGSLGRNRCGRKTNCGECKRCKRGRCVVIRGCVKAAEPKGKQACRSVRCGADTDCRVGKNGQAKCIPNGECPDANEVQCLMDPCRTKDRVCPGARHCVSDYCGGCNAHFYDENYVELEAGSRQCNREHPNLKQCSQIPEVGLCKAGMPRYYFDRVSGNCRNFTYGGCGGNPNRFESLRECERTCKGVSRCPIPGMVPPPDGCTYKEERPAPLYCPSYKLDCPSTTVQPDNLRRCSLPRVTGMCEAYMPSFGFNRVTGRCERFIYGGCGGNENRFPDKAECEETCKDLPRCPTPRLARPAPGCSYDMTPVAPRWCPSYRLTCNGTTPRPALDSATLRQCSQPKKTGMCRAAIPAYYFDRLRNSCQRFTYGGCGKNDNNFATREQCEATCHDLPPCRMAKRMAPPPGCKYVDIQDKETLCPDKELVCKKLEEEDVCSLPRPVSRCRAAHRRFYHSPEGCRRFTYGGCGGNKNNFKSMAACQRKCEKQSEEPPRACPVFDLAKPPRGCVYRFVLGPDGCESPVLHCTGGECADPRTCPQPCDRCTLDFHGAFSCQGNSTCQQMNDCMLMRCSSTTRCKVIFGQGQCVKLPEEDKCARIRCKAGLVCKNGRCVPRRSCPVSRLARPPPGCERRYIKDENDCDMPTLYCTGGVCADPATCGSPCERCIVNMDGRGHTCAGNSTCERENDCMLMDCMENSVCKVVFGQAQCIPRNTDSSCAAVTCPRDAPCRNGRCQPRCPVFRLTPAPKGCEYRQIQNSDGCDIPHLVCTGGACSNAQNCPNPCDRCINESPPRAPSRIRRPAPGFRCERNQTCEDVGSDCNLMFCAPGTVCKSEFGVGRCVPVVKPPKSGGRCPPVAPGTVGLCAEMCSGDSNCPNDEKCCSNGCGRTCQAPVRACPRRPVAPQDCEYHEEQDPEGGCPTWHLACAGSSPSKAGDCPRRPGGTGGFGICQNACNNDAGCLGMKKCCTNGCGRVCQDPCLPTPLARPPPNCDWDMSKIGRNGCPAPVLKCDGDLNL